jgi:plastocyanin
LGTRNDPDISRKLQGAPALARKDQTLVFDVDDFSFKPTFVHVAVGSVLRSKLANDGSELHSFVIDGVRASSREIHPGTTEAVRLDFEKPGEYVFYCRFHRYIGMQGAVIVDG